MDMDSVARDLRERAGLGDHDVISATALARRLSVDVRRVDADLLRGGDACLTRVHGEPVIYVRRGLSIERLQWVIAHELGERELGAYGYRGDDVEQLADAVAAAILMPRAAFRGAAYAAREDLGELAKGFVVSETAVALRLAEARVAAAVVVVCPTEILARSAEEFVLPSEPEIRRGALEGRPGVRSVRLTDARRRTAYVAA